MRTFIRTIAAVGLFTVSLSAQASDARSQRPPMTPEQQAEAARRREAEMNAPRPIAALDSVWTEELTWMEVRDAIKAGKTTGIILTGGVESNGPHLATGKHNFILKVMGEAIARKLGNALVAPILTLEPGRPDGDRVAPGSVVLSQATYRAVLTDMANSLRGMGFTNVVLMGDSGGNQGPMKEVAAALDEKYKASGTRFYFIPEYYDYSSVQKLIKSNGIPEQIEIGASQGSDGLHEEYGIDALMALYDPKTIRIDERTRAKRATINGVPLLPMSKTLEMARKIVELRATLTVDALRKAMAGNGGRINPMIALHERGLPVFGVTHPAIVAGRGPRGGAETSTPAPLPSLTAAAQETVAYRFSDFAYDNYSPTSAARFNEYMTAILAAGGSAREHAFISKVPIIHTDPAVATRRIAEQLNAGHVGVMLQEVEGADEVKTALAAMRFVSKGGMRPDAGVGLAAQYWKVSEAEYRQKADPWPLNKDGELVLWAIVESKKGIANIREIAQVPGLTVIVVGAGTLGGVFSSTGADGQRVRDQVGFDAGVSAILSACKEFRVPCSYPANNPKEIEELMSRGFTVFTMQRRDAAAFDAITRGRELSRQSAADTQQPALSVQYRAPLDAVYRSLSETDAVRTARAAHEADPKNIAKIIDFGIAQSGVRQFREAIATFSKGLAIEPNNALLLRWRGHRHLSVREFDQAFADLSRGSKLDPSIYGNWYHLGIVQFLKGDFNDAAASFSKALPIAPDPGELAGSNDWLWMSLSRAGRGAEAKALLDKRLDTKPEFKPIDNAYTRRIRLYRGEIGPEAILTAADTDDTQIATLAYGLGNWYLVRGDKVRARQAFERSIRAAGGWPGFGFIVSETELAKLR